MKLARWSKIAWMSNLFTVVHKTSMITASYKTPPTTSLATRSWKVNWWATTPAVESIRAVVLLGIIISFHLGGGSYQYQRLSTIAHQSVSRLLKFMVNVLMKCPCEHLNVFDNDPSQGYHAGVHSVALIINGKAGRRSIEFQCFQGNIFDCLPLIWNAHSLNAMFVYSWHRFDARNGRL